MLDRILSRALPGRRVLEAHPLTEGLRNSNFKLILDSTPQSMVLRLYEHDASLCRKEIDVMRLVGDSVPVPEVVYAEPEGLDDIQPFAVLGFVEGITFRELRRGGDSAAIAEAAFSAGQVLAEIGRFHFAKPGWLGPGPPVGAPLLEGANPMPRFVDLCLGSERLQGRMPQELRDRVHVLAWDRADDFAAVENESRLVHCDFNKRNLLVRRMSGRWSVAAVLDWEFAVSATPLIDFGNFLRYERPDRPVAEPHFSAGYRQAGGELPHDWRRLSRLIDLTAMCDALIHEFLPDDAASELVGLVQATLE